MKWGIGSGFTKAETRNMVHSVKAKEELQSYIKDSEEALKDVEPWLNDEVMTKLSESGKRLKETLNITDEDIDKVCKELRNETAEQLLKELCAWGYNVAKEAGFTHEDSDRLLKITRAFLKRESI